ncbi:MAG: alanine dehydrogenase [Bacilli bacterium]|jgi:alanine dehydrogenase|nr:alanine dehydrogenase [Bacilli bacterium]
MKVGIPAEIKNNESRVGITPIGVKELTSAGHTVVVEKGAGLNSGITDEEYIAAGAKMGSVEEAWDVDMVVHVKEPQPAEFKYFKKGLILYTYLHLAPEPELTQALQDSGVVGIAYETVQETDGSLPLLAPMSEVAGFRAAIIAATWQEKHRGGNGILLSGVTGTPKGKVVVIGAGVAGMNAAKQALGLGARVTILDINLHKLKFIDDVFPEMQTLYSSEHNIAEELKDADAVISTVLIPGYAAPKVVKEYMVKAMKPGSIIVDVAIDQGGSVETIDHATTHDDPVFEKFGVNHYSVANMPGTTARTSTYALTNACLRYMMALAKDGIKACLTYPALLKGVNTIDGKVTFPGVAEALNKECYDAKAIIERLVK